MRNLSEPVRQCIAERLGVEAGRLAERLFCAGAGKQNLGRDLSPLELFVRSWIYSQGRVKTD
jgi:hypothetical protein